MTQLYGLIGKTLKHSFSQKYFREKFKKENIGNSDYLLFELESIRQFPALLAENPDLCGLNVTIPYKLEVMQFLDQIDDIAKEIGAVNTVKISKNKTTGYNTDYLGFKQSLHDWISPFPSHLKALILGTGGASRAVAAALKELSIPYRYVSRSPDELGFNYQNLHEEKIILREHELIINTTPLGTSPNINDAPSIPYESLSTRHFLYDLVYNPAETLFLKLGKEKGAKTKNGLEMLELQAEKAWEIWNSQHLLNDYLICFRVMALNQATSTGLNGVMCVDPGEDSAMPLAYPDIQFGDYVVIFSGRFSSLKTTYQTFLFDFMASRVAQT